MIQKGKQEI